MLLLKQNQKERDGLQTTAEDSRSLQHKLDELQRALRTVSEERELQVKQTDSVRHLLAAKEEEVLSLTKQKSELSDLVKNLEASLQQADNKRSLELLQAQYDQVCVRPHIP